MEQHGRNIFTRVDPDHPDYADWMRGRDEMVAELPGQIAELRDELQSELAAFDAFDVVADLWLSNVPKDRETYRESTEEGMSAIPELAATLMIGRPARAPDGAEWFAPHCMEVNEKLRTLVMLEGFRMMSAATDAADPVYEELRARARFHRLGVRGASYSWQEEATARQLCGAGDVGEELSRLLGFSVDQAVKLAEGVTKVGLDKLENRMVEARTFVDELMKAVELVRAGRGPRLEVERRAVVEELAMLPKAEAVRRARSAAVGWASYGSGTTLSFTASDVAREAGVDEVVAAAFLDRFSTGFGLRLEPPREPGIEDLRDRPVLADGQGNYLCSSPHNLLWAIRPAFESAARDAAGATWKRYESQRRRIVEERAVGALSNALCADWSVSGVHFETEEDGQTKRPEIDGLVRLDTALFIVESKASAMRPAARRGAPDALHDWLEREVGKAGMQVRRTHNALAGADPEVRSQVTDQRGVPIAEVDLEGVEDAIELVVILEDLSAVAPLTWRMADAGFLPADEPPIVISLHELEVVCDVASRPCDLVHYFLRRKRLNRQRRATATDELDFFMHYLQDGLFWEDVEQEAGQSADDEVRPGPVQLLSFTDELDAYYMYTRGERRRPARKPGHRHHRDVAEALRLLDAHRQPGWLALCLALLDFDTPVRERLVGDMRRLKKTSAQENRRTDRTYFAPGFGVTVMAVPPQEASQLPELLTMYCMVKKHQMQAAHWAGFGVFKGPPELFQTAVVFTHPWSPDPELDELVATLPSYGYEGKTFDGRKVEPAS
jgi:hypothetical protein